MLTPTLMKRVFILGLLFFLVILSCKKEEKKEEKPLTNPEKIARELQKELGAFDEMYHYNDSLIFMYAYRPEADKTKGVKGVIDRTLNMVGEEVIPNMLGNEYNYEWDTPTEKISMRGTLVHKDSGSYVNVWIYAK